jgi:hypothetical protein
LGPGAHRAVITRSDLATVPPDEVLRGDAIVEQVIAGFEEGRRSQLRTGCCAAKSKPSRTIFRREK